jgi:acetyltransferase-like isoleucine patch superfamily enzyme
MYIFCSFYGVKLGSGCKFWKRTVFFLQPGSSIKIGDHCSFRSDFSSNLLGVDRRCIISTHSRTAQISIGNGCGFSGTSIGAKESIEIGQNVIVGANSTITDFDWHSLDPADRDNQSKIPSKRVIIEDNVWIGANCIILKGVRIGRNTVVGSGSIVTRDLEENAICGGNPCKVIKKLAQSPVS